MRKTIKNKSTGITLIALVVTIIILLILAGISISMLIGDNGILTQATDVKEITKEVTVKEQIEVEVTGSYGTNGKLNLDTLKANISRNIPEAEIEGEEFPMTVMLNGYVYKINDDGEVVKVNRTGINVGDYINYTPDEVQEGYSSTSLSSSITGSNSNTSDITQDILDWQILKIYENGSMDLIGSPTTQSIIFEGAMGYNNGVYVMHDICENLYSKKSKGIIARSVSLEDFEDEKNGGVWNTAKKDYINNKILNLSIGNYILSKDSTNNTITYRVGRSYYPNLYEKENGSGINTNTIKNDGIKDTDKAMIDMSDNQYKQASTSGLTTTLTSYTIEINELNYGNVYKVLTANNYYWVASRSISYSTFNWGYAQFCLRTAQKNIGSMTVYSSSNSSTSNEGHLRPVVHIGSEVQVETCKGTNNTTNPHIITRY